MDNNQIQQLVQYVISQLQRGVPEAAIRQALLQFQWRPDVIDYVFAIVWQQYELSQASAQQPQEQIARQAPAASGRAAASPKRRPRYGVIKALRDISRATRNNSVALAGTITVSYIVALVSFSVISTIMVTIYSRAGGSLGFVMAFLLLLTIWNALAGALMTASTSIAFYDGLSGHKRSLSRTLKFSLGKLRRVAVANLLLSLVVLWPVVLIIALPLILLLGNTADSASTMVIVLIDILVALSWMLVTFLRFALVPTVALFEPKVSLVQTFGRSRELLGAGGQWFIIKGWALLIIVFIVLSAATGNSTFADTLNSNNLAVNALLILLNVLINGVAVALYRNRLAVKG